MTAYIIRRVLIAIPTLLVISFVIFAILALAPGDPMSQFAANPNIPAAVRERIRESLGLNDPWIIRYGKWMISMFRGEWGFSFASRVPVIGLIFQRLPQTLTIIGIAYVISILIAIPVGIISSVKPYSIFDNIATTFAFIGFSVPTFFTGLVLILIFSVQLGWFPFIYDSTIKVTNWESFVAQNKQSIMPVTVLAQFQAGTGRDRPPRPTQ
jgi:peptide/nickel transport system permease protein